ncbi:hypothetical protein [Photobacterium leiognathi]|uniref:hypothetical protein n=1 Tax=Photobacterium leiognathi TaxID=553611 RepID=UPI00273677E1|nr:hypothetical protein [Photobacterium leiognathi]
MNSYRIIEVSKKLSVGDIYGSIITHSFDDSSGFFVNKKRRDIVKASHVYKKLITKNIKDIEGNQEVVSYFDYIETKFNIISSDDKSYIVIIDPPRESKVFNNDLKKHYHYSQVLNIFQRNQKIFILI